MVMNLEISHSSRLYRYQSLTDYYPAVYHHYKECQVLSSHYLKPSVRTPVFDESKERGKWPGTRAVTKNTQDTITMLNPFVFLEIH